MATPTDAPAPPACGFPEHPGPAGHVNACQLCPNSPTYWRGQDSASGPKVCGWTRSATDERPA